MAYLLSVGKISYQDYLELSREFCKRDQEQNRYLMLFEMAPRTFGQTWGEQHISGLLPEFIKATKENLADENSTSSTNNQNIVSLLNSNSILLLIELIELIFENQRQPYGK